MFTKPRTVAVSITVALFAGSLSAQSKKLALLVNINKYAHAHLNKPDPLLFRPLVRAQLISQISP